MKAHSFEQQLRYAEAPAADAEAQTRARRAALAEFARVHAEKVATPSAPARPRARRTGWPFGWNLKNGWLGGVATTCVLVIGVSVVYLMPPRDREIPLNKSLTAATDVGVGPQAQVPAATRSYAEAQPAAVATMPATTVGATSPDPSTSAGSTTSASPAIAAGATASVSATPSVEPAGRAGSAAAGGGARSITSVAPAAAEGPSMRPSQIAPVRPTATRTAEAETRAVEPVAQGASTPEQEATKEDSTEVSVTSSRTKARELSSPSPVATVSGNDLSEVTVTGAKRSRLRDFFRRSEKASAPSADAPSAATAPNEGRDQFTHFETNPVKRVADDPISTFSVDVDTAAYSFVRRKLNEGTLPQVDSVRVEEMINYFDYHWPVAESRDQPFKPTVTVSDSPWGEGKKLIHIGIKGYALPARQQPDVNLVLLLDVSGSMSSPDKLPLAVRSMELLLDSLKPTDTVAIVVYAGAAGQVLAPTPVRDREAIVQALSSLRPGGSTAGAEGIRLAYALAEKSFRKGGVNRILLATDGDFNVGITNENELKGFVEREREKGVYLSVLGFGEGNYRDEMAQTLAQNGNGVAAYIDTLSEARKVLVQEATSSLFPIAKDVKLQVEFNPATVAEYRLVGYETRALNREDFNNDKVDAGDVGSGHSVTAIYEITPVGSNATLMDESRYAARSENTPARGKANEYGFLKIRYKLPNGFRSRLLEQPILRDAGVPTALREDVEFSTAVAGFAQILRGSRYTGSLSFEDVRKQAQAAVGEDPYGYRSEFVQLVNEAQRAR